MEDGTVRMQAKMFSLVAQLNAEQAYLEGMKAANEQRAARGEALAYDEPAFIDVAERMETISNRLAMEI